MLSRTRKSLAVIAFVAALAACSARIPNAVTPDEYAVYSEWLKGHFSKNPPSSLFLRSRTFAFHGCDKGRAPRSLTEELNALGEAEYRLDIYPPATNLRIPWKYDVVDDWRLLPRDPGQYRLIIFSRVAFDGTRSKALFAVSDSCGGECGWGRSGVRTQGKRGVAF